MHLLHWTHSNKWQRYLTLKNQPAVSPHLPETLLFNNKNFLTLIKKYPIVYLKPVVGTGGFGVIKITSSEEGYILHYVKVKRNFADSEVLLRVLAKIINKRPYLVQQGIEIISLDSRPLDFRVLLLKPHDKWEKIGIMGKQAAKNKCVTNYSSGGKAITFESALRKSLGLSQKNISQFESELFALGLEVAESLSKDYRYVREIGMDIAIDTKQRFWILETNSMPMFKLFKYHANKGLYAKISRDVRYIRRNYRKSR